ncbi:MAG: hypothetical protein ACF8XB_05325 [Planctomycetota bacterium JB042]
MIRVLVTLAAASALAGPAVAQCGFNDMQFSVSPPSPAVGQPITITGTNTSSGCIWNQNDACLIDFVKKTDCNGAAVFSPICLQVITPIQPGASSSFTWDQKDDLGQPVAAGTYAFDIKLTNMNGQSLSFCVPVTIGPSCPTPPTAYGAGNPGTGGLVPTLGASGGQPQIGNPSFALDIANGLGGAPAILFVSPNPANLPVSFGTLLVDLTPPFLQLPFTLGGAAGVGGAGSAVIPAPIPNDANLIGAVVHLQCMVGDPASSDGISHTAGLTFGVCP